MSKRSNDDSQTEGGPSKQQRKEGGIPEQLSPLQVQNALDRMDFKTTEQICTQVSSPEDFEGEEI